MRILNACANFVPCRDLKRYFIGATSDVPEAVGFNQPVGFEEIAML
jgi:hypothetical protein